MEPIYKFFEEQFGLGMLVLTIAFFAICYAIWRLAVLYTKKSVKVDNLPCETHEHAITRLVESVNQINITLAKLETGQENITRMMGMLASAPYSSKFTDSHSPISLTEKGKEVAERLNLKNIIEANWPKISAIIEGEKNPYDIQTEFIYRFLSSPEKYIDSAAMDRIKKDAYINGNPLIEYMRILGIMSRDRYFSEHKIAIQEIDKNDPSKSS